MRMYEILEQLKKKTRRQMEYNRGPRNKPALQHPTPNKEIKMDVGGKEASPGSEEAGDLHIEE